MYTNQDEVENEPVIMVDFTDTQTLDAFLKANYATLNYLRSDAKNIVIDENKMALVTSYREDDFVKLYKPRATSPESTWLAIINDDKVNSSAIHYAGKLGFDLAVVENKFGGKLPYAVKDSEYVDSDDDKVLYGIWLAQKYSPTMDQMNFK